MSADRRNRATSPESAARAASRNRATSDSTASRNRAMGADSTTGRNRPASTGGAAGRSGPPNPANGADAARKRSRRGRGKGSAPATAKTSGDFWGSVDRLPPVEEVTVNADPSSVARSLGRPPFPGHEAVSEYYLRSVYDSSAKLAEVLATAGDLLASDDAD